MSPHYLLKHTLTCSVDGGIKEILLFSFFLTSQLNVKLKKRTKRKEEKVMHFIY